VCLPEDDTVFLSSQDEKNETLVDMKPCGPEDGEALEGSSCGVSYMEHSESLFLTLGDNQNYSSQAEAEVQDVMLSSCHSISCNSEVITDQGYTSQRNTNEVGHECYEPSQDMDSLVMLDNSKDDIGPNPEMMADEDDGNDLGENMGSAAQGDINKDVAEIKREDSLADHVIVESDIKDSVKEIDSTADNIDHSKQYVLSGLTKGNAGNINAGNSDIVVTCDNAVSSGLNEGNTNQTIMGGVVTYETIINADGVDAYKHLAPSGAIGCGDAEYGSIPTTCAIAEAVPHEDTTCTQDGTVPCEDTTYAMAEAVPCEDTTYAMAEAVPCEDTTCTQAQDVTVPREGDTGCTDAEMPLGHRSCCIKDEASPENTFSDAKRPLLDGICEEKDIVVSYDKCTQKDDRQGTVAKRPLPDSICDVKGIVLSGDKCIQKDDAQGTDKEWPLPDRLCKEKVVSGDGCTKKDDAHVTDSKRPLPEGEKDTSVSQRCIQKDNLHGTDAKIERHYKRRKVLAAESKKERSSTGA
jgi:sentrin-specific protease 7